LYFAIRSPESVSCRELEHKLQNVLVISSVENRRSSLTPAAFLAIRSSIVSDRWDEDRARVNMEMLKNRKLAFPKPKKKRSASSDAEQRSAQTQ